MGQLGPAGDEAQEVGALVRRAVVGHDRERMELAGRGIEAVGQERMAQQSLGGEDGRLDRSHAYALTDRSLSLDAAARRFGVPIVKGEPAAHGVVTPEYAVRVSPRILAPCMSSGSAVFVSYGLARARAAARVAIVLRSGPSSRFVSSAIASPSSGYHARWVRKPLITPPCETTR